MFIYIRNFGTSIFLDCCRLYNQKLIIGSDDQQDRQHEKKNREKSRKILKRVERCEDVETPFTYYILRVIKIKKKLEFVTINI